LNPDVVAAVGRLQREGVLDGVQAARFGRVARGDLVSVHGDLRVLLYASVLVTMAGVSTLVAQNLDRLGPVAVATALAVSAAACLLWVARRSAPFTWDEVRSPHLALDYLLLLGVLLTGATLAYVEANFTALGRAWPWHLFIVSMLAGVLAVRFDSRVVFSLALSTFAAWRGVRTSLVDAVFFNRPSALRAEAILCGVAFLGLGYALVRLRRKAHFEPVAVHLGWLLVIAALLSGSGPDTTEELAYSLAVLAVGVGLAVGAFRSRRFPMFVMGVLTAYAGLSLLFLRARPEAILGAFFFLATSVALLVGLFVARRGMDAAEFRRTRRSPTATARSGWPRAHGTGRARSTRAASPR
jgi:hypothetical protein